MITTLRKKTVKLSTFLVFPLTNVFLFTGWVQKQGIDKRSLPYMFIILNICKKLLWYKIICRKLWLLARQAGCEVWTWYEYTTECLLYSSCSGWLNQCFFPTSSLSYSTSDIVLLLSVFHISYSQVRNMWQNFQNRKCKLP